MTWELREGSHLQGFNIASKYYFSLKANETLDATTVKAENFKVTTAGTNVPVVGNAAYLSQKNEVRLYLTEEIANYVSLNPYSITSTKVKDSDGNSVSLSAQVYFNPENNCELYDISIANAWFIKKGITYYSQPLMGPCDLNVRVVNASDETKTGTIKVYAVGSNESRRLLKEEQVTLLAEEEITKGFKELTFFEGEKIDILLS